MPHSVLRVFKPQDDWGRRLHREVRRLLSDPGWMDQTAALGGARSWRVCWRAGLGGLGWGTASAVEEATRRRSGRLSGRVPCTFTSLTLLATLCETHTPIAHHADADADAPRITHPGAMDRDGVACTGLHSHDPTSSAPFGDASRSTASPKEATIVAATRPMVPVPRGPSPSFLESTLPNSHSTTCTSIYSRSTRAVVPSSCASLLWREVLR